MREISSSVTFEIRSGETVAMRVQRSTKLMVHGGAVWLTRSDDTEDYWLAPGHALHLRRGERLWMSVEDGERASIAFSVAKRCDERAMNWFARVAERLTMRVRGNWRTV